MAIVINDNNSFADNVTPLNAQNLNHVLNIARAARGTANAAQNSANEAVVSASNAQNIASQAARVVNTWQAKPSDIVFSIDGFKTPNTFFTGLSINVIDSSGATVLASGTIISFWAGMSTATWNRWKEIFWSSHGTFERELSIHVGGTTMSVGEWRLSRNTDSSGGNCNSGGENFGDYVSFKDWQNLNQQQQFFVHNQIGLRDKAGWWPWVGTGSLFSSDCYYLRVMEQVTLYIDLTWHSVQGGMVNFSLTGLPFAISWDTRTRESVRGLVHIEGIGEFRIGPWGASRTQMYLFHPERKDEVPAMIQMNPNSSVRIRGTVTYKIDNIGG